MLHQQDLLGGDTWTAKTRKRMKEKFREVFLKHHIMADLIEKMKEKIRGRFREVFVRKVRLG